MLRIQEFMTKNVQTIGASQSAAEASEAMRQHDVHHLVVRSDGQLLGVVSDRDLGRAGKDQLVSEVMTTDPVSIEPTATVREAANKMRGRSIGCLPVVTDGKVVGIVTISDLLELIGRGQERAVPKGERRPLTRNMRVGAGRH